MEILLSQDVEALGKSGTVVKVKEGYARNYLLPRKLACLATPANIRKIEEQKVQKVQEYERVKKEAEALAEKLSKVSCTVTVEVNDLEKLYGSVTEVDIAKAIELEGFLLDRKNLILEKPIEELGIFEVGVKLHPEVTAKVRVWVAKK
jgi:large subunit ribosomal protein L9